MGQIKLVSTKKVDNQAARKAVLAKHKGKPVLTSPEKDEILLTMATTLGFYDPT